MHCAIAVISVVVVVVVVVGAVAAAVPGASWGLMRKTELEELTWRSEKVFSGVHRLTKSAPGREEEAEGVVEAVEVVEVVDVVVVVVVVEAVDVGADDFRHSLGGSASAPAAAKEETA